MIDQFGRKIDYMRISVTDRCNLRCRYCMPEEGIPFIDHKENLTYEEILRVARIGISLGITKFKITGGEPLVRKGVADLIRQIKALGTGVQVTLTTNGMLLSECMQELADAGIDGINVSLDTLDREEFQKITGVDALSQVMAGIHKAMEYPWIPLKINCVPTIQKDLMAIAELAKKYRIQVRFIEMMPIGMGVGQKHIYEAEIHRELEESFGKAKPFDKSLGNGPCHYYSFEGFEGKIGFISAISHRFCETCNRIRLTSTGELKSCLEYPAVVSVKEKMRSGCSDQELKDMISRSIYQKPAGHHFMEPGKTEEEKYMTQIGG